MNILVFGASGRTGRELVKKALSLNHRVTAFVRNPAKINVSHENLKIIQGDIINSESVEQAVAGHDAVLSTLGAASPFKYDHSVVEGIGNIVKAMEKTDGRRLIYMSAINVEESRSNAGLIIKFLAPILLRTESAGHEARERIIKRSALDWTIVRPAALTNGPSKPYRRGENVKANGISASISRVDVADFMIQQLTDNTFLGKAPIIMY
jgi:putative NADH-flavin reductase